MLRHPSGFKKVAREVVLEVPERYDGYREQLLHKLTEVIGCQGTSPAKAARRPKVHRVLDAFGQQVAAQTKKMEKE